MRTKFRGWEGARADSLKKADEEEAKVPNSLEISTMKARITREAGVFRNANKARGWGSANGGGARCATPPSHLREKDGRRQHWSVCLAVWHALGQ